MEEMKVVTKNVVVMNKHIDAAQRLTREHLTDGHEPYPALMAQVARMLAEYEAEILATIPSC